MRDLAVDAGAGLLFISHDLSVVRLIADRIAAMYLGKTVEVGETASVWTAPQHPYPQALLRPGSLLAPRPRVRGPVRAGEEPGRRLRCWVPRVGEVERPTVVTTA